MTLTKEHPSGLILGATYTDESVGITGIATTIQTYVTGCDRVCLERLDNDGEKVLQHWCDIPLLVDSDGEAVTEERDVNLRVAKDPGGPGKASPVRERKDPGKAER